MAGRCPAPTKKLFVKSFLEFQKLFKEGSAIRRLVGLRRLIIKINLNLARVNTARLRFYFYCLTCGQGRRREILSVACKIVNAGAADELISENGDAFVGASAENAAGTALLADGDGVVFNGELSVRADVKTVSVAKLLGNNYSSVSVYLSVYSCFFHNFLRVG